MDGRQEGNNDRLQQIIICVPAFDNCCVVLFNENKRRAKIQVKSAKNCKRSGGVCSRKSTLECLRLRTGIDINLDINFTLVKGKLNITTDKDIQKMAVKLSQSPRKHQNKNNVIILNYYNDDFQR